MKKTLQKIIRSIIGLALFIIGFVGIFVPILNGIIFLIAGLVILSFESPYLEKKLLMVTKKHKTTHALHNKIEKFLRKFFG